MKQPDIAGQLERLTQVESDGHRVVTCYIKLEPRDRARGKYLIKLKNRVRAVQGAVEELGLPRDVRESVTHDCQRILDYLGSPGNLPATQGLAVFACGPLQLFEAVPLPGVYRSRLSVDRTPLVRELAAVLDEFGRLITAVVDRTGARFFEVTAYNCRELDSLRADYTRGGKYHGERQGFFGRSEHDYHSRIREEKRRHYANVAQQLFQLNQREPAHGVVLAGPGAEAGAVEPFLHPYLAQRLMGTVRLNPKDLNTQAVHVATLQVRRDWERRAERNLVDQMQEGLGSGWAVNGLGPTLRALGRGQVRTLLVGADAAQPGFRCADTGRLALSPRDCRGEGEPVPVLDVVDEAIEEALRQQVGVNVVYDEQAAGQVEGLAGLLRFR